jgi:hypothetical protein
MLIQLGGEDGPGAAGGAGLADTLENNTIPSFHWHKM